MKRRYLSFAVTLLLGCAMLAVMVTGLGGPSAAEANDTYVTLPLSQNWMATNLITTDNDWSAVPGILGYDGRDDSTSLEDIDPQTRLLPMTDTNIVVKANHQSPNSLTDVAIAEFEMQDGATNPMVGIRAQSTYDFPFLLFHINTAGLQSINIQYDLIDIDASGRNAQQQVALQYRVGNTGNFTNLPDGYVADATEGPNVKGLTTHINVTLPADANNQTMVQFRIMTSNADTADEWVGIDNISVTGTPSGEPTPTQPGPTEPGPTPTQPGPTEPPPTEVPGEQLRVFLPVILR